MDMSWLATEAKALHQIFTNLFFVLILTFLVIGVILEYFKFPLGSTPQFPQLVGRAVVACVLLVALPEIMNALATITDAFVADIGKLTQFKLLLGRLGDRLGELSWSWTSVKDTVIIVISYLSFFMLYVTVYLMDAYFLFAWSLLYIFSPLLIAMFVFPLTEGATRSLFRSLIDVCLWKIIWCCLSALLWSFALSEINKAGANVDFLTVIILNIMLAFSILITPKLTASFLSGGISNVTTSLGETISMAANLTPVGALGKTRAIMALGANKMASGVNSMANTDAEKNSHAFHKRQRK